MTIQILNTTFKGLADLKFLRHSDDVLMHWPTPQNFVLQDTKEQRIQMSRNNFGERTRVRTYTVSQESTLSVAYSHMQPELLAFRFGRYFEQNTKDLFYIQTYTVTKTSYDPVTTGFYGFGITADADAKASIKEGHLSVELTQQPFATFVPTTLKSFAVGANGAVKFSNDLLAARETVSLLVPYSISALGIGDELVGDHSVRAKLVDTNNEIVLFYAPNVTPNLDGAALDPSADTLELPLFVNTPPGACFSFELEWTGLKVKC